MKAADTVMTEEQQDKLWDKYEKEDPNEEEDWGMLVARKQAQISFKAGYHKALAQLAGMTAECEQIGRREVLEWIKPKLEKIDELTGDIRGDWTDPRKECRAIWDITTEIEEYLK